MEEVVTILEVYNLCNEIKDFVSDDVDLPTEVIEVLKTFGDGENGNNDIEKTLVDIRDSLMYDEENTAIYELSSRLEVIDTRLDREFECINFGLGLISSTLLVMVAWRFLSWLYRILFV